MLAKTVKILLLAAGLLYLALTVSVKLFVLLVVVGAFCCFVYRSAVS